MAEDREIVKHAVAGDIIGLYDTGNFQIGDTIFEGRNKVTYKDLPQFTPEVFMQVEPKNVMKQKSYHKGIAQLVQEGAIQLYKTYHTEDYILGAVGQLQFEVFEHRMKNEYNSEVIMKPMGKRIARWINPEHLDESMRLKKVAGSSLELVLYRLSGTPIKGIILGTGVTAVIQSSSATSIMVVEI